MRGSKEKAGYMVVGTVSLYHSTSSSDGATFRLSAQSESVTACSSTWQVSEFRIVGPKPRPTFRPLVSRPLRMRRSFVSSLPHGPPSLLNLGSQRRERHCGEEYREREAA